MGRILSAIKKIVPIAVELITIAYVPPAPGWGSVGTHAKNGSWDLAGQSAIAGFTGLQLDIPAGGHRGTSFEVGRVLNPIDLEYAPFPKIAGWAVIAMEGIDATLGFARSIVKDIFKAI